MSLPLTLNELLAEGEEEGELTELEGEEEETVNPVLPTGNDIIWAAVFFFLLWGAMRYILLPPIQKTRAERAAKIAAAKDASESASSDLASVQAAYDEKINAARAEAAEIIDAARAEAEAERSTVLAAAEAEVSELRASADAELAAARSSALSNLRPQVAGVAASAASTVVGRDLDASAAGRRSRSSAPRRRSMNALMVFAAEKPNGFWLPGDVKEFWWGLVAFIVVFGALAWKVLPLFKKMLADRADKVEAELAAADKAQADADAEMRSLKERLGDADADAAQIVADARHTADQLKVDLAARARSDAAALKARAEADIEGARRQAQADLQAEVSAAALAAAEEVVRESIDDATQASLIDRYIEQVGA